MFFFMRTRLLLYNIDRIHGIFKINYFEYLLSLETVSGEKYFLQLQRISRTDEGPAPRPKYIFNKMKNEYLLYLLYKGLVHHHPHLLSFLYYNTRIVECLVHN